MGFLTRLIRDQQGQDLIEYALLVSFLAIASVIALQSLGPVVAQFYQRVETIFTSA